MTDRLELHFIELRKLKVKASDEPKTSFERWLQLLRFSGVYSANPEMLPRALRHEEGIQMAIETLQETIADEGIQELIRASEKAQRDLATALETAAREGKREGKQEGKQEGVVLGLQMAGFAPEKIAEESGIPLVDVHRILAGSSSEPGDQ